MQLMQRSHTSDGCQTSEGIKKTCSCNFLLGPAYYVRVDMGESAVNLDITRLHMGATGDYRRPSPQANAYFRTCVTE